MWALTALDLLAVVWSSTCSVARGALAVAHRVIPTPVDPPAMALDCVRYWWKHCAEQWASPWDSVCEASGRPFPPAGTSWDEVLRQMDACSNSIWQAVYVKVDWDPRDFAAWAPWARESALPNTFGLCVFLRYCTPEEIGRHLVCRCTGGTGWCSATTPPLPTT
mmetsp:Transcript_28015/g.77057  ORF Transcript_28015/g.77057 Transcript_28015/m.77057 type:complete len:164 (+) Transcript_28015:242-733(+)